MNFGIIDIQKVGEHDGKVAYAFHHKGKAGTFFIDSATGEFSGLSFSKESAEAAAGAAAQSKVQRAWKDGGLPEKLKWIG